MSDKSITMSGLTYSMFYSERKGESYDIFRGIITLFFQYAHPISYKGYGFSARLMACNIICIR